jgi:hypothetical protein
MYCEKPPYSENLPAVVSEIFNFQFFKNKFTFLHVPKKCECLHCIGSGIIFTILSLYIYIIKINIESFNCNYTLRQGPCDGLIPRPRSPTDCVKDKGSEKAARDQQRAV